MHCNITQNTIQSHPTKYNVSQDRTESTLLIVCDLLRTTSSAMSIAANVGSTINNILQTIPSLGLSGSGSAHLRGEMIQSKREINRGIKIKMYSLFIYQYVVLCVQHYKALRMNAGDHFFQ
jgi:hypothetical protein